MHGTEWHGNSLLEVSIPQRTDRASLSEQPKIGAGCTDDRGRIQNNAANNAAEDKTLPPKSGVKTHA